MDGDPLRLQGPLQHLRHIRVLPFGELRTRLDDGHGRSQAAKGLGQLQRDGAARAGHVDDLSVIHNAIGALGLLHLARNCVPATAGGSRGHDGEA